MSDTIRFYFDEHISHAIRDGLRRRGIDVITPLDANRIAYSDEEQLAFAYNQGRVMVTHDPDYLALHRRGVPHAGIAWSQANKLSVGEMIEALQLIHDIYTAAEMQNQVEYL